ncbi:MAG: glycosyltransferase family 4 protein [Endomicrobiaceae bacterium]|nr:glycosyltransferase family 4 protein [Endomicrobiaceae bacterium]
MKKILIISPYFPFPARDGGKVRLYNLIKHLSKENEVYLLAYIEPSADKSCVDLAKEFCTGVFPVLREEDKRIIRDDLPRSVSFFYTQAMIDELKKVLDAVKPDVVQLDFLIMTEYVKHIKNVPVFYTEHDMGLLDFNQSFHDRDLEDNERFFEWKKLVQYEKKILDFFSSVIVLTERDKKLIENLNNNIKATIIPTGVDSEFYKPNDYTDNEKNLVFVGHYRHFPNADAIVYFVKNIFPKVIQKIPDIKLYIVGSGVTKAVEELKNDNIIITGEVEDIKQYLKRPNIFVAPVRLGGGIKGKVLEAMAMGVPVVATKEAVSGIDYSIGDFALVSDDADVFADNVVKLYNDDDLYKTLAENSRKIVEENYNWKKIADKLNNFYSEKINKK